MTTPATALTTSTAVDYEAAQGHYVASLVIVAHPGQVHKALYALGLDTIQPTFLGKGYTGVVIPLRHVVLQDVAQAAADALTAAIVHVLPYLGDPTR